jgi:hypothetical protein
MGTALRKDGENFVAEAEWSAHTRISAVASSVIG